MYASYNATPVSFGANTYALSALPKMSHKYAHIVVKVDINILNVPMTHTALTAITHILQQNASAQST